MTIIRQYNDHTITFDDVNMRFRVTGPLFMSPEAQYESFKQAKSAIDECFAAALAQQKAASKVAVPVLGMSGEKFVVVGIHSRTGRMLLRGEGGKGYDKEKVYPDTPFAAALIAQRVKLMGELSKLERVMSNFTVSFRRVYGGVEAKEYQQVLDKMLTDLKMAEENAHVTADAEETTAKAHA